jgi:hypothetical protein
MRIRLFWSVSLALCALFAIAPSASLAQQAAGAGDQSTSSSAPQAQAPTAGEAWAAPSPEAAPELPFLTPEPSWTSANPCRVTCPNGSSIDCTWSWAGDPTFCCWKNSVACQSYYCSSGSLVLSKFC